MGKWPHFLGVGFERCAASSPAVVEISTKSRWEKRICGIGACPFSTRRHFHRIDPPDARIGHRPAGGEHRAMANHVVDIQIASMVGVDRRVHLPDHPLDRLGDVEQINLIKPVVWKAEESRLARPEQRRRLRAASARRSPRRWSAPRAPTHRQETRDEHHRRGRMTGQSAAGTEHLIVGMRDDGEDDFR